jgi:hypothetical protein
VWCAAMHPRYASESLRWHRARQRLSRSSSSERSSGVRDLRRQSRTQPTTSWARRSILGSEPVSRPAGRATSHARMIRAFVPAQGKPGRRGESITGPRGERARRASPAHRSYRGSLIVRLPRESADVEWHGGTDVGTARTLRTVFDRSRRRVRHSTG